MDRNALIDRAKQIGFSSAAIMATMDLVVVPEYRKYCEQNLCGCYNLIPACPPQSGTVEDMASSMRRFESALILQTVVDPQEMDGKTAKLRHNEMSGKLLGELDRYGIAQYLYMSAGPWKGWSCMSAYCVDAQKMADSVGMLCWAHDGLNRFFSLILF